MRRVHLVLLVSVLALSASSAFARDVKISGTHGVGDISAHCNGNGTFFNGPNGSYGCAGNGGGTVTCSKKGKCVGTVSIKAGAGGKGSGIASVVAGLNKSSGAAAASKRGAVQSVRTNAAPANNEMNMHGGSGHSSHRR